MIGKSVSAFLLYFYYTSKWIFYCPIVPEPRMVCTTIDGLEHCLGPSTSDGQWATVREQCQAGGGGLFEDIDQAAHEFCDTSSTNFTDIGISQVWFGMRREEGEEWKWANGD